MFFLCALKLVSNPQDLKVQESELVGAQWMPLSNFMDQDFIAKREVFSAMMRRYNVLICSTGLFLLEKSI